MNNLEKSSSCNSVTQTQTHVSLSSDIFLQHYEQFFLEQKPDPLLLKQLQSLHIEWNEHGLPYHAKTSIKDDTATSAYTTTDGILTIMGEYTSVALQASCKWNVDVTSGICKMHFELHIESLFPSKIKGHPLSESISVTKREKRLQDKVRNGVMTRMETDPYIRRIINKKEKVLLCDASIHFKLSAPAGEEGDADVANSTMVPSLSRRTTYIMDELEERVYVSEEALEGLRRCMFSQMESPIFVMELLLAMPYLPQRSRSSNSGERMDDKFRRMLSERVVLRVLEDVMLDECEREGEDDLLSDLNISNETNEVQRDTNTKAGAACVIGKQRRKA